MLKLDLGGGSVSPPGFTPLGRAHGSEIYPLPYGDGTVDALRASHCLEHFAHGQIAAVLKDWARVLKPGGSMSIAVPDFREVAERYLAGTNQPTEGYVMGGQIDADDYHKAVFDEDRLKKLMAGAGLVLLRPWTSDLADAAALPISLNLEGVKPFVSEIGVAACMSIPRLAFAEHAKCAFEALPPLGISLTQFSGAFWGQCLERCIEQVIEERNPDAILTLDYDTVFSRRDVSILMQLMMAHPEADAIAPLQSGRGRDLPLFTIEAPDGQNAGQVLSAEFAGDLAAISTAHFGLTLIRTEKLRALPKPWFLDIPAPDGGWGDGHVDADISFWRKWKAVGNTLFLANRVAVGHIELSVSWPGQDLRVIHQPIGDYRESGAPKETWR